MPNGEDDIEDQENFTKVVQSLPEAFVPQIDPNNVNLPKFAPDELVGRTLIHDTGNGERVRAEIVKKIEDLDAENTKTSSS